MLRKLVIRKQLYKQADSCFLYKMNRIVKQLPRPGQLQVVINKDIRVLLMSNVINTLTRRVEENLKSYKAICSAVSVENSEQIFDEVNKFQPDIIICPFLKTSIPASIYNQKKCLIMHPGIAGDRGANSLDWAILDGLPEWGVTVLEASDVLDGGNIWSTETFYVPKASTKTSLYNGSVSDSAVRCVADALSRFSQGIEPMPPYSSSYITGNIQRNMKKSDRRIDWENSAEEISARVRMSDTTPGAIGRFQQLNIEDEYRIFDAHIETGRDSKLVRNLIGRSKPGQIVGQRQNAILVKTGDDNALWIGQMKKATKDGTIKLPSMTLLDTNRQLNLPTINEPCAYDDIRMTFDGPICYVHFDFYNGAMDKYQAARLEQALQQIDDMPHVKVVALMGGERFFSTGIHLCAIENSMYKQREAFINLNKIDDVINSMVKMRNKATVAVLQGNAAAGGAMFAIACDVTVAYQGAFLTPSYKAMNLFGSEYWTYFLPARVGQTVTKELIRDTTPISALKSQKIGLVDHVLFTDKEAFKEEVREFIRQLYTDGKFEDIIAKKQSQRNSDWLKLIEKHRQYEMSKMQQNFRSKQFLTSMHNFVYKIH